MEESSSTATNAPLPRRPFLVWVTQLILVAVVLTTLFSLLRIALALPALINSGASVPRLTLALLWPLTMLSAFTTLFIGLVRRKRWAWYCSTAFALLILFVTFHGRISPPSGPLPLLPIAPNQMLGAAVGEAVVTILVVLYPLRMYFSDKVRTFFGIPRSGRGVYSALTSRSSRPLRHAKVI